MRPLDVFADESRHRCCAISLRQDGRDGQGVGTGTALEHNGELFVVTCAHVARPRGRGVEMGSVVFDGAAPIGSEWLEVVFIDEDEDSDLALLRVARSVRHRLQHVRPIEVSRLATAEQFAAAQPGDGHGYAFIGSPWDLRAQDGGRTQFRCLAYRARVKSNDGSRRLTLSYEAGPKEDPLPEPAGISGSTLFMCDALAGNGLWTPGPAIAVLHGWRREEKYLVCSPIAPIREFLLRG
ncbi:MAG: trypsin-like peptidase domain-containing protein [Planctomycetota bacterium]